MALDLIVTVVAAGLTLIAAVAGICGMNLAPLPVQDSNVRPLISVGRSQMTYRLMKAVMDPPCAKKEMASLHVGVQMPFAAKTRVKERRFQGTPSWQHS